MISLAGTFLGALWQCDDYLTGSSLEDQSDIWSDVTDVDSNVWGSVGNLSEVSMESLAQSELCISLPWRSFVTPRMVSGFYISSSPLLDV